MPTQAAQNLAQNLSNTNLGVKFVKTLYTNPYSLSPTTILSVLKAAGIQVPKDVAMTAELAQCLISGQALYTSLNATDFALANTVTGGANFTSALTSLLQANGLMDEGTATTIKIGSDVALICSSGGYNVGAWISLAIDLSNFASDQQSIAEARAAQNLQDVVNATLKPQIKAAGEVFADFQNGTIGIFGLITKMAIAAPAEFPQVISQNSQLAQMFPMLQMIPTKTVTLYGKGSSETGGDFLGQHYTITRNESTKTFSFQELDIGQQSFKTKLDYVNYFRDLIVGPWTSIYITADSYLKGQKHADLFTTAILSMVVAGDGTISATDDYSTLLQGSRLTPWDLDNNSLVQDLSLGAYKADIRNQINTYQESGLSLGFETPGNRQSQSQLASAASKVQAMKTADNIDDFLKDPQFSKQISDYFRFPIQKFESNPTLISKSTGISTTKLTQAQRQSVISNYTGAWRDLKNYISTIHLWDSFINDPYFKDVYGKYIDTSVTREGQTIHSAIPSVSDFESSFRKLQGLSVTRNVNLLAKKQIAKFLGTTPDKLVNINQGQGPGIWRVQNVPT